MNTNIDDDDDDGDGDADDNHHDNDDDDDIDNELIKIVKLTLLVALKEVIKYYSLLYDYNERRKCLLRSIYNNIITIL